MPHIDTEGYDWEVLRTVDLGRCRRTVVLYEHVHLGAADRGGAHGYLDAAGYAWKEGAIDTIAVRRESLARATPLRRTWRRLARVPGSR